MNKRKKLISLTALFIVLSLFGWYVWENSYAFEQLSIASPWIIAVLIILFLFSFYVQALINIVICKLLNVHLTQTEAFGLMVLTRFSNYITPLRGGMAARAYYLKHKHNCSYTDFMAMMTANIYATFFTASTIGSCAALYSYYNNSDITYLLPLFFGSMFLFFVSIMIVRPRLPEVKNKILNRIFRIINGWYLIREDTATQIKLFGLNTLSMLRRALTLYFQFQVFGFFISWEKIFLLGAFNPVQTLIGITPAGLGIREFMLIFAAETVNVPQEQSIPVSILARAIAMSVVMVIAPIFMYYFAKILKIDFKEKNESEPSQ